MRCANCDEKIVGKPIKRGKEYYCSADCAEMALDSELDNEPESRRQEKTSKRGERTADILCAYCGHAIGGDPYMYGTECFCSEECASRAVKENPDALESMR